MSRNPETTAVFRFVKDLLWATYPVQHCLLGVLCVLLRRGRVIVPEINFRPCARSSSQWRRNKSPCYNVSGHLPRSVAYRNTFPLHPHKLRPELSVSVPSWGDTKQEGRGQGAACRGSKVWNLPKLQTPVVRQGPCVWPTWNSNQTADGGFVMIRF